MQENVGFIGLGIMGKPMAKNLLNNNVCLYVNDINQQAVSEITDLGGTYGDYTDIAKLCSVIMLILPNGKIVRDVLFGENGLFENIRPGTVVCDMSSVTPADSQYCYEKLREKNVFFIDAPVSGGEPGAVHGTLAFMAGGDDEGFQRMIPYFEIMGTSHILVGKSGAGSVAKLANQIIVNNTIAVVSEAMVFAVKAGADPEKVYAAIRSGLAGSAVLDAKMPMILDRNFTPGGKISINHKDIKNVVESAHKFDVPIPYTAQLYEILQTLKIHGHMDEDHCGIIKYFEGLADVVVERELIR